MRLYLDSAPVIYWVEKVAAFYPQVDARIKASGVTLVSSHLTLMESLVRPLRRGNIGLQQEYDSFFATQLAEVVHFSEAVFRKAAQIRANHNYRTPDALHLAAALRCRLQCLLDQRCPAAVLHATLGRSHCLRVRRLLASARLHIFIHILIDTRCHA